MKPQIKIETVFSPIAIGKAGTATTKGGVHDVVTFPHGTLTDQQREYIRLCAIGDFAQVIAIAKSMNEGLTFHDAAKKYLLAKMKINA